MKVIIILVSMLALCMAGHTQTQELEQLKLNLEKLAQLRLMLSQAKQGYQTLQNGYNAVRDAAKGNYNLHKDYLDGLIQVNAQVRNAPALKRFMDNNLLGQKEYRQWYSQLQPLGLFSPKELSAIEQSYQQITSKQSEDLELLQIILAPGKLRMSDGERIAEMEVLAGKSDGQLTALRKLIKEQTVIAAGRARNKRDIEAVSRLYGLH